MQTLQNDTPSQHNTQRKPTAIQHARSLWHQLTRPARLLRHTRLLSRSDARLSLGALARQPGIFLNQPQPLEVLAHLLRPGLLGLLRPSLLLGLLGSGRLLGSFLFPLLFILCLCEELSELVVDLLQRSSVELVGANRVDRIVDFAGVLERI